MGLKLDREKLLTRLPAIEPGETPDAASEDLRKLSLASAVRLLAEIDHENEVRLCRSVAQHLLGEVPEPEEIDTEE